MRNFIIMIVGLLLSFNVFASYIRVVGTGIDFESAKRNAFATAIELHVGTVVVSEREVHNRKLTKEEILLYSSGYVDDFKIVSQNQIGNQVQVILDVSVNANKISNRILGKGNNSELLNSAQVISQLDTYQTERNNADKLLQVVLNDYPYRAYNLQQLPYYVTTFDRKFTLNMPYRLSWNYSYLLALKNVLEKTQDAKPRFYQRAISKVSISAQEPNNLLGKLNHYHFNDVTHPEMIANTFYDKELRIMGKILNKDNKVVWYVCHNPIFLSGYKPAFYSIGDPNNVRLMGTVVEEDIVKLDIGPDLKTILQGSFKIQLQIVRNTDC